MKKLMTLCLVHQPPKILLGMKKKGFGMGRWNGFGGKVEDGERIEDATKREIWEEAEIKVEEIEKVGEMLFEYVEGAEKDIVEVHLYRAEKFSGTPQETEEMKPQWFLESELPLDQMWPDDKFWMPLFLAGKKFKGKFLFDGHDKIIKYKLEEIK
jgi:8-oxo-dGTP diphosphatase/2-hydroxy-dATP diphosphatase